MVMIANLQYGWTLFINPIDEKYHWGRAAIQVAFTIFIVTETWAQPFGGYLIDRFGPKPVICGCGALVATAWVINSVADSLILLYRCGGTPKPGPPPPSRLRRRPTSRYCRYPQASSATPAGTMVSCSPCRRSSNATTRIGLRMNV
jgi:Major Facilitator Superfamily